jgi:transposase
MSPPSTPRRQHFTSRDDRIRIQTLHEAGHSQAFIQAQVGVSRRQVGYSLSVPLTPKKRTGRPPTLSSEQVDELILFIRQSRTTRQMTWQALAAHFSHWHVTQFSIGRALRARGYTRRVALAKPPLSEENKRIRLQWAQEHVHWEKERWVMVLWSDETWVTGGRHRRIWVTRMPGEALDDTCLVDKVRKKRGWMFWACFSGSQKGPSLFWEKEWRSINKEKYCERIIPLVHGWMRMHPGLVFMHDGAPGHSAQFTRAELHERGINPMFWPAFSPDLNPIEAVWNKMKDWIELNHPDLPGGKQRTYDQLRAIVQEAWDSITPEYLDSLVDSMRERCQAVIDAQGGYTKY